MIDRFIGIKEYDMILILRLQFRLHKPFISKVNITSTIDKHKQFNFLILFRFLYFLLQLCIGSYWIYVEVDTQTFKKFLC